MSTYKRLPVETECRAMLYAEHWLESLIAAAADAAQPDVAARWRLDFKLINEYRTKKWGKTQLEADIENCTGTLKVKP